MRSSPLVPRSPRLDARRILRMGAAAVALAVVAIAVAERPADTRECRKNYYSCDLNAGGSIDPANPDCCWQPLAGAPSRASCAPDFYKCDLNAGGRIDRRHPGCCWTGR